MAFNYSPKIVTDGLVLYLDAANQRSYVSGSTEWNDLSRVGNNGTLINGPAFSSANGGNLSFDGIDDYVNYSNPSILDFTTNSFSISTWVRANAVGVTRFITGKLNSAALVNGIGYGLYLGNAGTLWTFAVWPGTSNLALGTGNFVQINTWVYLVGVRNAENSTASIYTNGALANSINISATNVSTTSSIFAVGGIGTASGTTTRWNGNVAVTSVYNRALSATEVLQNYNATRTRFGL